MKIVIIDDQKQITDEFSLILAKENHELLIVNDPSKAVYSIVTSKPDIVFIDFLMPQISGLDLLSRMKSIPGFSELQMYFLVHEEDEIYYESCDTTGIQGYITKPLKEEEIFTLIPKSSTYSFENNEEEILIDSKVIPDSISTPIFEEFNTLEKYEEPLESSILNVFAENLEEIDPVSIPTNEAKLNILPVVNEIVIEQIKPKLDALTAILELINMNLSSLPKALIAESIKRSLVASTTLKEQLFDLEQLTAVSIENSNVILSFETIIEIFKTTFNDIVLIHLEESYFSNDFIVEKDSLQKVLIVLKKYFRDLIVDYTIDATILIENAELGCTFSFLPKNEIVVTLESESKLIETLSFVEQIAPNYLYLNRISTTLHVILAK